MTYNLSAVNVDDDDDKEDNQDDVKDVEENAYRMKTLNDAVVLRNRVIDMLEQAENETNPILIHSTL